MCLPFQSQTNMLKLHLMVTIRETSGSHEDEKYNNSRVMTYSSAVCSVLIHLVVSWCIPQHCVGNGMHRLILVSPTVLWTYQLVSCASNVSKPRWSTSHLFLRKVRIFHKQLRGTPPLSPSCLIVTQYSHPKYCSCQNTIKNTFVSHLFHSSLTSQMTPNVLHDDI